MWCRSCEQECEVVEIDFGIGFYEYGGAPGWHIDKHHVSRCCEAEYSEVPPSLVEPDDNLIPESEVAPDE